MSMLHLKTFFLTLEFNTLRCCHVLPKIMIQSNNIINTSLKQALPYCTIDVFLPHHYWSSYASHNNLSYRYGKLKKFGCLCFLWLKPYTSTKLDSKSQLCILLGCSPSQSYSYICLDPKMFIIYHFHVQFIKTVSPYSKIATSTKTALNLHEWYYSSSSSLNSFLPYNYSFVSIHEQVHHAIYSPCRYCYATTLLECMPCCSIVIDTNNLYDN